MKYATLFVSAVAAQATAGEDCSTEQFICQNTQTTCVYWMDSMGMEMASCQDCIATERTVLDGNAEAMPFSCPDDVEDGAINLGFGAAALLSAAVMLA